MSEYSDRNRLNLKENNLSLSLNTSFSSNKSFYDSLEDHTKRDILFLIKSGYNKKAVIKLYLIVKPAHVSEAIECLSKKMDYINISFIQILIIQISVKFVEIKENYI